MKMFFKRLLCFHDYKFSSEDFDSKTYKCKKCGKEKVHIFMRAFYD